MPFWNSCWQISTAFCTYALQVAWIKADTKAILAIHEHVITNNARLSVTHNDFNTWTLNLRGVKREDRGQYMCQVNTDPMKSQVSVWSASVSIQYVSDLDKSFTVQYLFILRVRVIVNHSYPEVSKIVRTITFSLKTDTGIEAKQTIQFFISCTPLDCCKCENVSFRCGLP